MAFRVAMQGAGALAGAATAGFAYHVQTKTKNIPPSFRGPLHRRMGEVVSSFRLSRAIQHRYTAENHTQLVASLASKTTTSSFYSTKEEYTLGTSYYAGYLPQAIAKLPEVTLPIFRYEKNLPVALPPLHGSTHKGFIHAGSIPLVHDPLARAAILNGDYIRCRSRLVVKEERSHLKYRKVDVVITGTTDPDTCREFHYAFLKDFAYLAAGRDPKAFEHHPYADTPVLDPDLATPGSPVLRCSKRAYHEVGNLTNMPESVKRKILAGTFTYCDYYTHRKTKSSQGGYEEVGAIVTGTTDPNICQGLIKR